MTDVQKPSNYGATPWIGEIEFSRGSTTYAPTTFYPACEVERNTWPIWVVAFTMLTLLGASSVQAASNAKHTARNRTSHAQVASPGTRMVATGTIDAATSSLKAVSADNHFTWVRVTPATLVVQAGRRLAPGSIAEGDKLLCRGGWVDDAWGPIFEAKRVEIIGHISDTGLQEKVAAACQSVTDGGSASGGLSLSQADAGDTERQGSNQQDYPSALEERFEALDQAKQALWEQVDQSNGCQSAENRRDRAATGDDRDLRKDFEQARQNFDAAVDRLGNISPIPGDMSLANLHVSQSCASFRKFSDDIRANYSQITVGVDEDHLRIWLVDYNEGMRLSRKAIAEVKAHR